ncbi:MAG: hypothetical protein AVDCRST_MAG55-1054, partial [uncultured Rubrobacteraceae bacterium]
CPHQSTTETRTARATCTITASEGDAIVPPPSRWCARNHSLRRRLTSG